MGEYVLRLRERVGSDLVLQLPSVSVAIWDDHGSLLLVKHLETGHWLLPGGSIEPGETPADAAVRECWEETGLLVKLTRLLGVFGGPEFLVVYSNGDQASYVMTVFEAQLHMGELVTASDEIEEARFLSRPEIEELDLAQWAALVLDAMGEPSLNGGVFAAPSWQPPV